MDLRCGTTFRPGAPPINHEPGRDWLPRRRRQPGPGSPWPLAGPRRDQGAQVARAVPTVGVTHLMMRVLLVPH
jgi:hypothetical protein